jgi:hypothetical protein
VSEADGIERPWEREFEAELSLQRRAESMLMLRGAAILFLVTALVLIRAILI